MSHGSVRFEWIAKGGSGTMRGASMGTRVGSGSRHTGEDTAVEDASRGTITGDAHKSEDRLMWHVQPLNRERMISRAMRMMTIHSRVSRRRVARKSFIFW